ncbi:4-hydroxythreonine-4-phosphate dehydrogenase PdxA [Leucobacter aridicollis]|uniref:4-hydroxythreonine-4-phosphate dehydrogenase n=1 Tax=Leucobacter aridicollis TaxID=283878 RepID=A0A852RBR8_9MICO|nr:4-hydroxythreonine-4-phosphate dehydrogenase PdxA [Leucobacter aridicollis]MBL3682891.1 4-hydroxythreonine-4-phosphate dehydrogenase PdxA [Leucobacter aridicollis]NYD26330.1 4-hydroxythreonine-4-phosphate dehydrogenase [Leucobacter aridicollis]
MTRHTLALTLGDPAGIGPEIAVQAVLNAAGPAGPARAVIVGDPVSVTAALTVLGLDATVRTVASWDELPAEEAGVIDVFDIGVLGDEPVAWGEISARAGASAVRAIEVATQAALDGKVAGIVTAPINKEAIWAAGSEHLGHTEMLAELTGSSRSNTMFVARGKKIFFATRHVSLRGALERISTELEVDAIDEALRALKVYGTDEPRLAVAAINPHGGENGKFGTEEIDFIRPAVAEMQERGHNVVGPIPADSVFHQLFTDRYDAVLSQYHDQGHIPAKTIDFNGTISVTVGLPILRTSVDHGTAFDIAGKAIADPGTMISAYLSGAEFAPFAGRIREDFNR